MISSIKKLLHNKYIDYKYQKIISKHDLYYDESSTDNILSDELKINGCIYINNFFSKDEILSDEISNDRKINWVGNSTSVKKISPVVINERSLAYKILKNKELKKVILDYLGENAKLDYIEFQKITLNSSNKSISEKWHYDNVGKRIKVFCYLNDCKNIYTDYLIKTNNIYHKKYSIDSSRISENLRKKYKQNSKSFFPKIGSVFILDTNGYHRGVYRNDNEIKDTQENIRKMILFEFSNIQKSENFHRVSSIIGPRSTYFDKSVSLDDLLIDKNYLTEFKNFYLYDLNFTRSF